MYFWIDSGEDGTRVLALSKEQLDKRLKAITTGDYKATFLDTVPNEDKGCWTGVPEDAALILKGEVVVPKAMSKVTEYSVD